MFLVLFSTGSVVYGVNTYVLPVMVSIKGRYIIKHGLMSGATVGTFSCLGFLALATGDFALARRIRNLSLKLMKVDTLKDKICMSFFFIKGSLTHDFTIFVTAFPI